MRILLVYFLFFWTLFCVDGYAAPRKSRTSSTKPLLEWVNDNSKLFTIDQATGLNALIASFKDSVRSLLPIVVVTQSDYSTKSPYYRAIKPSATIDKWYISESKAYADGFVILVRPRSRMFTTPELTILSSKNSLAIAPFITPQKIERLQNEYTKYLNDAPNSAQAAIIEKLVYVLRSRFFDGSVRDYHHAMNPQDEMEINRFIQTFRDSTAVKVAVVTTANAEGEDAVFGRAVLQQNDSDKQMIVEYKNLDADIVFVFYPKGVHVFSQLSKDRLSDKALQTLINKYVLPASNQGQYKQAIEQSLAALSAHLNGNKPLDGMTIWEKLVAVLLGVGIPALFGWLIFKNSLNRKTKTPAHKPQSEKKPTPTSLPSTPHATVPKAEKKDEKKPSIVPTPDVPMKRVPHLHLSKPTDGNEGRGWTLDNTGSLAVTMSRIDEVFKPISPRNGHEKMMLETIDYMRMLRVYTDHEIAHSLGKEGISPYLDELYAVVDPAAVRVVFSRGLDLLLKNYAERDSKVSKYVGSVRH